MRATAAALALLALAATASALSPSDISASAGNSTAAVGLRWGSSKAKELTLQEIREVGPIRGRVGPVGWSLYWAER